MTVSITKEIDIKASVAEVMEVLADVESLPRWSAAHRESEILAADADGWPTKVRSKIQQFGVSDEMLLDYTWYDGEVSWQLAEPSNALNVQNASYVITDNGDGSSHVVFSLEVDLKIKLPSLVVKQAQKMIADVSTKGLKKEVETRYS